MNKLPVTLTINRWYQPHVTHGEFILEDSISQGVMFKGYTLERPWLFNQADISCIKKGDYKAIKHNSPKHGWCIKLLNVEDRTEILIHIGNYLHNTLGCILVGEYITHSKKGPAVYKSKPTFDKLYSLLTDTFTVKIRGDMPS